MIKHQAESSLKSPVSWLVASPRSATGMFCWSTQELCGGKVSWHQTDNLFYRNPEDSLGITETMGVTTHACFVKQPCALAVNIAQKNLYHVTHRQSVLSLTLLNPGLDFLLVSMKITCRCINKVLDVKREFYSYEVQMRHVSVQLPRQN